MTDALDKHFGPVAGLRYVEPGRALVAYFCTDEQYGDDWDDAPWEHNASPPFEWVHRVVVLDHSMQVPGEWVLNSDYSVDSINAGAAPWLSDKYANVYISAGVSVEEFIAIAEKVGAVCVRVEEEE